ncbi:MAG: hypothetical protein ACJ763_18975 [Bdellovibrionia bacterium]
MKHTNAPSKASGKASAKGIGLGMLFALGAALTGCGQQPFIATASQESLSAPGTFTIPAKVDFLLVEDDTGSMNEIFPQISSGIPGVLSALENNGWDYHFATIPLTTYRSLSQVTASHYDGNWGASWKPAFPGAAQWGPQTVLSSVFRDTSHYSDFLSYNSFVNGNNGLEPGLQNILYSLNRIQSDGTNFLRDDAMLVVLVVGNGDDTSGVSYCTRSDGITVQCGSTVSIDDFKNGFNSLKASSSLIRFYAAVSSIKVSNQTCQGSNAYIGSRYQQMAAALNGKSYNICAGPSAISSALGSLASDLTSTRLALQTRYLQVSQEPDTSSIVVTRNDGVVIPQSATNGWTYAGYVNNAYAIDYPVPMNQFSGYAVELHGSYKLTGDQNAKVSYTPKGLHSTN